MPDQELKIYDYDKVEIGEELGLTRERVRQIETEALGKLHDGLEDPREREAELAAARR